MNFKDFPAAENDLDRRLDKVLRKFLAEDSLSLLYKSLRKGLIKVNSKKVKEDYRLQKGDLINIADFLLKQTEEKLEKSYQLPAIVFKNQHILVLNKEYDQLVQGNEDSLDKMVQAYYKKNFSDTSLSFSPGPLHRLDRKTTGLICFSLSLQGARWFSQNIKEHKIQKSYLALVQGRIDKEEEWKDYIQKEGDQKAAFKTVKASSQKETESKEAWTSIKPLARGNYQGKEVSLLDVNIHTGRTHQIRAQSALHKHPLLGDQAYGGLKIKEGRQDFYLQAYKLTFPDNPLELPKEIKIPVNPDFADFLIHCGIRF